MEHTSRRGQSRRALTAIFAALLAGTATTAFAVPGVTPSPYATALEPGQSVTITKTVETPVIPPNPDIVFLADTTTSMGASISNVQANADSIVDQVLADQPTAQFAVADYKDVADYSGAHFNLRQQLTADPAAVAAGINAWTPLSGGGSDAAEDWIGALGEVPSAIDFRSDGTPVVVMFGDSTSHDPSAGFSLATATAALQAAGVRVIAIAVPGADGFLWNGLDTAGQATAVTNSTGGTLASANPSEVSAAILSALQNLPAEVTHQAVCDPGVSVSLTPPSQNVTSGGTVSFDETITLAADAPQGTTVSCQVSFLVNGQLPGPEFVQQVDVDVLDVEPPVVTVSDETVEATGPDGAEVDYDATATDNVDGPLVPTCAPPSGSLFAIGATVVTCTATDAAGNTGSGTGTMTVVDTTPPDVACSEGANPGGTVPRSHNQDGFFLLGATDLVDPDPVIYVRDSGSGTLFGPYADGQQIKYTETPGGQPRSKSMPGDIVHLFGTGDAEVIAVDSFGNTSAPVSCLVPPPPM
ncbi:HYR domain-containing protein [Nocardioides sp. Root151]|uniref:HYR domain-containing protein n=1 Tax=Nocardioides sp. Root151 TaxID=1736475 RepID=UPI0009EB1200|nr:HYR domain-containing protein [Nocardioides sp. Root151]